MIKTATDISGSITKLRDQITDALRNQERLIIVELDDVDRLSPSEILDIFKLVRLTGSFPNLIYIIACDRKRIEKVLTKEDYSGRDYLEKIVQWPYNLPKIPPKKLPERIDTEIAKVVGRLESEYPFNQEIWNLVRNSVVCPLIETMRDVRRYANAVWQTVVDLEGQVELAEVLGLEAARLFLPDTFSRLSTAMDVLTQGSPAEMDEAERDQSDKFRVVSGLPHVPHVGREQEYEKGVEELIGAEGKKKKDVVRALIRILFPKGPLDVEDIIEKSFGAKQLTPGSSNTECRVRNRSIFRFYLERTDNEGISALFDAKQALECMHDQVEFDEYMRNIEKSRFLNVIHSLNDLEKKFQPEHARPGIIVLLNILASSPREVEGYGLLNYDRSIAKVVAGLLETQTTADAVDKLVKDILPKVTSLSSKWMLFDQIKSKSANSEVFLDAIVQEYRSHLLDAIQSTSIDHLAGERRIEKILSFQDDEESRKKMLDRIRDEESSKMTFAILYISYNEVPGNAWPYLKDIYGEENLIRAKIDHLQSQFWKLKPWIKKLTMDLEQAEMLLKKAVLDLDNGTAFEQPAAES